VFAVLPLLLLLHNQTCSLPLALQPQQPLTI
jgi:hypothetical protein